MTKRSRSTAFKLEGPHNHLRGGIWLGESAFKAWSNSVCLSFKHLSDCGRVSNREYTLAHNRHGRVPHWIMDDTAYYFVKNDEVVGEPGVKETISFPEFYDLCEVVDSVLKREMYWLDKDSLSVFRRYTGMSLSEKYTRPSMALLYDLSMQKQVIREDPSINDQYQRRPEKSRRHAQKVKIDMSYSYYLTN